VSGIIKHFFGDNFFQMLCKETNWYYLQNQGKYDSSSKGLKWVDVSVVCAVKKRSETRYICEFCIVPLYKGVWDVVVQDTHTSANVCCRYGWLNEWICCPFIVWGGLPRSHLHPQFLFYPVSIRRCGNVC
jgi:hypothetical protein